MPDLVPDSAGGAPGQGLWLTARAWLPPETLTPAAGPPGFTQGGVLDELAPGPALASFSAEAAGGIGGTGVDAAGTVADLPETRLTELGDDELIGVMRSFRREASWAQAGELAAVAELARRRARTLGDGGRDDLAADAADAEVAAALTLTGRAAQMLTDRAVSLQELPRTLVALATGQIDMAKVLVMLTGLAGQDPDLARTVEAQVIDQAPAQTTGQLRAAVNRALLAADPAAAERRRAAEEKQARIEQGPEPGGLTATLTGRYLPVTETTAAWQRITALARQQRAAGEAGTLDELRTRVYLALLTGEPLTAPDGNQAEPGADDSGGGPQRGLAGLHGSFNLTVPLATLAGRADAPGELAGFGPVTAHTARRLAAAGADSPQVRWCVTVTDDAGQPAGHGCAHHRGRLGGSAAGGGWEFRVRIRALAAADCGHERASSRYRPPPSLWHLIQIRHQRCTFAGCRMPAARCDGDHTMAYADGGRTCECNLGPLCRHHHRVKHAEGWRLEQPEPGVLAWVTPAGWKYITGRTVYATV